jgi:uncharacterized protein YeaO (DUF488 family)
VPLYITDPFSEPYFFNVDELFDAVVRKLASVPLDLISPKGSRGADFTKAFTKQHPASNSWVAIRSSRGVPKSEYSSQNLYDVWFPNIAPITEFMKLGRPAESKKDWKAFVRKYRAEMADPEKSSIFDLLAALSHDTNFSVGYYCENEAGCHG